MADDPVELGVELLAHLEFDTISIAEAIDRIEAIATDPRTQRRILTEAERRGVIDREGTGIRFRSSTFLHFERDITQKEGDFACRRCGSDLGTGYFIALPSGDVGPYGSTCIRKVTGRA